MAARSRSRTVPSRHAALSISLPKQLRMWVQRRVERGGFGNVSEYMRALIRDDQARIARATESPSPAQMPGLARRQQAQQSVAVRDGGADAAVADFSAADWRELRE